MLQDIDPKYPPDDAKFVLFPEYEPNTDEPQRKQKGKPGAKSYPKNPPPKNIVLPFKPIDEDAGRVVEGKVKGHFLGTLYTRKIKTTVPGWLIELDNARLSGCMEIKDILSVKTDLEDMAEKIFGIISKSVNVPGISESTVLDVLRQIPDVLGFGLSFPHFMFAMGNIGLAKRKNLLLNSPRPVKAKKTEGGDSQQESGTKNDESEEQEATDEEQNKRQDASGYSLREKVFFSGLLIFEMYETISQIEDIYYKDFIPETDAQEAKRNTQRGIGISDIGFKKKGEAEWDRPLPPISKVSPYMTPMPFVTTRWKIVKPSANDSGRRRTLTSNRPIHMMIQPPKDTVKGKIQVMENKLRIRQAMIYLASQGDVVASLPYSHFLINISDTFLEKMEEYNHLMPKEKEKIYYNNDLAWIVLHAKELYRPHGLPPQVAKMPNMIHFIDAVRLRIICQHIRMQHWNFVCQKQALFREEVWKRMHLDRIPYGRLRDSFVYSFITYLPLKADLPLVHNKSALPY